MYIIPQSPWRLYQKLPSKSKIITYQLALRDLNYQTPFYADRALK